MPPSAGCEAMLCAPSGPQGDRGGRADRRLRPCQALVEIFSEDDIYPNSGHYCVVTLTPLDPLIPQALAVPLAAVRQLP